MTCYILDPVCAQELGHNISALVRYKELLNGFGIECVPVVSDAIDYLTAKKYLGENVKKYFFHYYHKLIEVKLPADYLRNIPSEEDGFLEYLSSRAAKDLAEFIKVNDVGSKDTLFYPSVDYYSIKALLSLLENKRIKAFPRVVIRWIGVMENNPYRDPEGLELLLKRLGNVSKERSVRHTAESKVYAEYLMQYINEPVSTTPTLVSADKIPFQEKECFTIAFPGSGRRDKGFDRIGSILDILRSKYGLSNINAVVQMLPPGELKHFHRAARDLVRKSEVTMLPSSISMDDMHRVISISDLVVIPYDKAVYRFRSSAVMAESAMYGRALVASSNCGFSEEVEKFKLGYLAETDEEFAEKIAWYSTLESSERIRLISNARKGFSKYTKKSYSELFEGVEC